MPIVTPNFNFNGQCEEAIKLYEKAFNAQIDFVLRYHEANPGDLKHPLTEEEKNYIFHSEIHIGSQRIMLSDNLDVPLEPSKCLGLVVTFDTPEEVQAAYEILVNNGASIIYPLHHTTYSSAQAALVDPFGFRWNIMTELN